MPFPSDTFLQFIRNSANWVSQEFESLYAQMEGYLRVEHKEDGSHGDISGDSLTLTENGSTGATGAITADGDITSGGDGTFAGNVTACSANAVNSLCQIGQPSVLAAFSGEVGALLGGSSNGWFLQVRSAAGPGGGSDYELRLWDLHHSTSTSAARFVYDTANSRNALTYETGGNLQLGDASHFINYIYAAKLNFGNTDMSTFIQDVWTVGVSFGGGTTGITYGTRVANYTRLNNQITATFDMTLTSKGSSTGTARLTGLPVTAASYGTCQIAFFSNMTTITELFGYVEGTTTTVVFQTGAAGASAAITDTAFQNATRIIGTVIYYV